jgi:hypothetical protein
MVTGPVRYKQSSPYYKTGLIENKFLDVLEYRAIDSEADDIYRMIGNTYQYRPDLMSYDLYKTVDYWWVFMMRNRDIIIDPIWDFTADKQIYIPKISTIQRAIGL